MGWKIYVVAVLNVGSVDIDSSLLESMGFQGFEYVENSTFDFNPKSGETFVANYNGNLLIANQDFGFEFAKTFQTEMEKTLLRRFPQSEIIQVTISYINSYSVFVNGKKTRLREAGDEIYQDFGVPLPEEIKLRGQTLITEEDLNIMRKEEDMSDIEIEEQIEFAVTYETAFELTRRIFGKRLDEFDKEEYNFEGARFKNPLVELEKDYGKKSQIQFKQ